MTSAYPGSLDSFNNPTPTTARNAPGYEHDLQHANANDAVEAIEAELGTDPAGTYATVKDRLDAADYNASLTSSYWKFKTGTSDADPGTGQFALNNAAKASATFIYLDDLTGGGTDVSNFMPLLAAGDKVFLQDRNDATKRVRYSITAAATDATGYWKVPVTADTSAGGEISNNQDCLVLWTVAATGGSGGGGLELVVNDDLSTLANMTSVAGTWAVSGGVTQQTDASANPRVLRTTAKTTAAEVLAEVEMRFDSGSGLRRFGLMLGSAGTTNDGATLAYLTGDGSSAWTVSTERAGQTAMTSGDAATHTAGNWVKIRMHSTGGMLTVWIDGTLIVGVGGISPAIRALYVCLYTYEAAASFRNLKVWTPVLPA